MVSEETLAQLTTQHGDVQAVTYNGHDIVFRRANRNDVRMHQTNIETGGAAKMTADDQFAQLLVVHVDGSGSLETARAAFNKLIDKYPYMVKHHKLATVLGKMSGLIEEEEAKS